MKWSIIAVNNMLAASRNGDTVNFYYWKEILEDCFPGNDLVMCCEDKSC